MVTPLVFRHGAAEVAFGVLLLTWAVFETVMRGLQALRAKGPNPRDPSYYVLLPTLLAAIVAAEVLGRRGRLLWPGGLDWPVVTGLALMVAGIGLRAWSIVTLGRFFQYQIKVQPGHQVVTSGPYRFVRHPSYTGIAMSCAGLSSAAECHSQSGSASQSTVSHGGAGSGPAADGRSTRLRPGPGASAARPGSSTKGPALPASRPRPARRTSTRRSHAGAPANPGGWRSRRPRRAGPACLPRDYRSSAPNLPAASATAPARAGEELPATSAARKAVTAEIFSPTRATTSMTAGG
jgi:protein-S-isoprenylcysteine O-methyltransferase Ste14